MRTRPADALEMSLEADIAKDFRAFDAHARILRAFETYWAIYIFHDGLCIDLKFGKSFFDF